MEKIIIIKYGELTTKKDNIGLFLSTLKKNVEKMIPVKSLLIKEECLLFL